MHQITDAAGKLLLGSSEGQVECVDIDTGRARWIYVFPVIRRTMSYSTPYGMPPYRTQQAADYWEDVRKTDFLGGSLLLSEGFDVSSCAWSELQDSREYAGRVVFDPSPDDPFPNLRRRAMWLAVYALLPIVSFSLILLSPV